MSPRPGPASYDPNAKVVPPPPYAWRYEHDCAYCGHETLKKPVWIDSGGGAGPYGTAHAAQILGRAPAGVTRQRDSLLFEAQQNLRNETERLEWYAVALEEYDTRGSALYDEPAPKIVDRKLIGSLFRNLQGQHLRGNPSMNDPATFAEYLRGYLAAFEAAVYKPPSEPTPEAIVVDPRQVKGIEQALW